MTFYRAPILGLYHPPPLSQNQGRMYFLPFLMGGVDNKMIYLSFPLRDPTYGGEQEHRGATQQHTSGD